MSSMQIHTREVQLPSGAILRINIAPFVDSKNLAQSLLSELSDVNFDLKTDTKNVVEMAKVFKEIFCKGFSSPLIESYLLKCMERCSYDNGKGALRIDRDTFEAVDARQDYVTTCIEVAKDNVFPFGKSLFADYKIMSEKVKSSQKPE